MQNAYLKKRNRLESTFQSAPKEVKNEAPTLPNSLLLAMHGEQSGNRHNPELENIMKSRLAAFRHQIPTAENEADKLSSGITSGTPEQVKQSMGERLGTDFSSVRFHTGESISQKADNMGARAWTQGNDVYFGEGGFHPTVAAHELVHTVQQGAVDSSSVNTLVPMGEVQMWQNPLTWAAQRWRLWKQRRRQRRRQRQQQTQLFAQILTPGQKRRLLPDMEAQHSVELFSYQLRRRRPPKHFQMGPSQNKRVQEYQCRLLSDAILTLTNLSSAQARQMAGQPRDLIPAQLRALLEHLYDMKAQDQYRAKQSPQGPGEY